MRQIGVVMQDNVVIQVDNVNKRFKTYETKGRGIVASLFRKQYFKKALTNVSFSVKGGELAALLGRNGSGKSTMIKILMGILFPDSGRARVLGMDPWKDRIKLASQIGVVLGAHSQLYWNLPAIDTFEFMRHIHHIPESMFRKRLKYFVKALNLEKVYKRQARQLSLGEQMKCNFVASVLHAPRIVFLDEPTIGVDLPSKLALRKVILEMQSQGTTFVLTTHIVEDIMIAQRVIILDKGRKMFDGKREELEKLFGDKRHVDIFFTPGSRINFSRFGRILNSENGFVRLEIEKEGIKSKKFMELLGNDDILDYKITDPGMNYVLSKLFKSYDRRKANKEMD